MQQFLAQVQLIASEEELKRYKRIIAIKMLSVFAHAIIISMPFFLMLYGFNQRILTPWIDYIFVFSLLVINFYIITKMRKYKYIERRMQQINVSGEKLKKEKNIAVNTWKYKNLPRW